MKKLLVCVALIWAISTPAKADETNSSILFRLGAFNVHVPFKSVSMVGLWDGVSKQGLAGAETPIASWKQFRFTGGAVTTIDTTFEGSPFIGINYAIKNPMEDILNLESFSPGLFTGYNFREDEWMVGLKGSIGLF